MPYQIKDLDLAKAIHSALIEEIRSKLISDKTIIAKNATHKIDTNPFNIQLSFNPLEFYCPEIDNLGDIYTSPFFKVQNFTGDVRAQVFLGKVGGPAQSRNFSLMASEVEMKHVEANEFEVISLGNLSYNY